MRTIVCTTAELGELVAAAFDSAASYSANRREVSALATRTVISMLQRAERASSWPLALFGAARGVDEAA